MYAAENDGGIEITDISHLEINGGTKEDFKNIWRFKKKELRRWLWERAFTRHNAIAIEVTWDNRSYCCVALWD